MIILKDLFHNKAEFRNLCTSGITRKCRLSWSFLPIPELKISHPHTLTLKLEGVDRNSWSFHIHAIPEF
jgi:hypothetical protein